MGGQISQTLVMCARPRTKFLIRSNELPQALINEVTRELSNYTTFLIFADKFYGSGTFATIDNQHGILTATHVLRDGWAYAEREHARVAAEARAARKEPGDDKLTLALILRDEPHRFEIPLDKLHWIHPKLDEKDAKRGPDIAFLRLPTPFLSAIKRHKSFAPLTKNPDEMIAKATDKAGFMVTLGMPGEQQKREAGRDGFGSLMQLRYEGHVGAQDRRWVRAGFDYCNITVANKGHPRAPGSYGGMSGGGVWKVIFGTRKTDPEQNLTYQPPSLAGVAYYEYETSKSTIGLRTHGAMTVYHRLVEMVRKDGQA